MLKKFKVFDFIAAGTLALIAVGLFLLFYRKAEYINIRVRVTDQDVLYAQTLPKNWYAKRFSVGDYELDALGRKITEVTGLEAFAVSNENSVVFLDLTVRATYDTRSKMYSVKGKQIQFGAPVRFNLHTITFDGIVTEFPGSEKQQSVQTHTRTVRALARGIEPYLANSAGVGLEVTNSNKVVLAKITKIEVRPAERVTTTDRGDLLLRLDPLYKDVVYTIDVLVKEQKGVETMFDSIPVKVDQMIPLNFENVSLFPTIIEVQKNKEGTP